MGIYRDKILEQVDLTKQHLDKATKWVEYDRLTKEELLKQLSENTISCKDVSFRMLGFSLAAINTIFSIVLSAIFIRLFIIYEKN